MPNNNIIITQGMNYLHTLHEKIDQAVAEQAVLEFEFRKVKTGFLVQVADELKDRCRELRTGITRSSESSPLTINFVLKDLAPSAILHLVEEIATKSFAPIIATSVTLAVTFNDTGEPLSNENVKQSYDELVRFIKMTYDNIPEIKFNILGNGDLKKAKARHGLYGMEANSKRVCLDLADKADLSAEVGKNLR
jgi:hypothetical protein